VHVRRERIVPAEPANACGGVRVLRIDAGLVDRDVPAAVAIVRAAPRASSLGGVASFWYARRVGQADDYEKRYMGGGEALARSRAGMPWWFHTLVGLAAVASAGSAVASGTWVGLATLPLLLLAWVLFMYLRITVTAEHVHVQLGLFGPKIPIADIVDAAVESYPFVKYGGWGLRFALDGSRAYSVPGHGGRGLRIRYKKRSGRESTVWVTSPNPEEILAAIDKARAASRVRVDVPAEKAEAPAEEVESAEESRDAAERKS
jgi:hypothetical protein